MTFVSLSIVIIIGAEFKNTFAQLWRKDRRRPLGRRHWKLVEHKKVSLSCTIIAVRKRYLTSILTFWLSKKLLVNYGFIKVSVQGVWFPSSNFVLDFSNCVKNRSILYHLGLYKPSSKFQIVLKTDLFYITLGYINPHLSLRLATMIPSRH